MDTLKVVQHNVHHWETKKLELSNIYIDMSPDIILINSHGNKTGQNIKIQGYLCYSVNSSNEAHDGSAIIIKEGIRHRLDDDFHTDVLCIKIETSTGPINIATTYLPPRRPFLPFPDFHKLAYSSEPMFIMGDLNAKHQFLGNRNRNAVGLGLYRFFNDNKLSHLGPNFPTFLNNDNGTTPDIILSNHKAYHNMKIQPGPLTSSDHIPIIVHITANAIKEPTISRFVYKNADWELFKEMVERNSPSEEDWSDLEGMELVDRKLDLWYDSVGKSMQIAIPTSKNKLQSKSIINNRIKNLQKLFRLIYNNSLINGWTLNSLQAYRRLKTKIIVECRASYEENLEEKIKYLQDNYKQPQLFWEKVKQLKGSANNPPTYILDHDGAKVFENREKEKVFRRIWENNFKITEEENEAFDEENEERVHGFLRENFDKIIPNYDIDYTVFNNSDIVKSKVRIEEAKILIKASKNTAPGSSGINREVLLHLPDNALQYLIDIFNDTLTLGYFPDRLKKGILNLIPKGEKSPLNPANYRPITLLEVPGKLLERLISKRLKIHLTRINALPSTQHGFRDGRGTGTALAVTCEVIACTMARRDQCCLVQRDVSKAFDKVWHEGLKYKLTHLGLPDHLGKIICDYLEDRSVRIRIANITGNPITIRSGVPQGGILSPTLYAIYTRDIPESAVDCHHIIYADDITQIITYRGKSRLMMANQVGREIEKINKYEKRWKIKTNQSKFTLLPIANKKREDVIADGEIVEYSNRGRILGMKITNTGYCEHVKDIKNRGIRALSELNIFKGISEKIKLHLVKAYILPILEYPTIPLVTLSRNQIMKIQRIQNRALRWVYDEAYPYRRNTEQLHQLAKLKPINVRLHDRANQLWTKIEANTDIDMEVFQDHLARPHKWFLPSRAIMDRASPLPLYT